MNPPRRSLDCAALSVGSNDQSENVQMRPYFAYTSPYDFFIAPILLKFL